MPRDITYRYVPYKRQGKKMEPGRFVSFYLVFDSKSCRKRAKTAVLDHFRHDLRADCRVFEDRGKR